MSHVCAGGFTTRMVIMVLIRAGHDHHSCEWTTAADQDDRRALRLVGDGFASGTHTGCAEAVAARTRSMPLGLDAARVEGKHER